MIKNILLIKLCCLIKLCLILIILYIVLSKNILNEYCKIDHYNGYEIEFESKNIIYQFFNPSIILKNKDQYISCLRTSTFSYKNLFNYFFGKLNYDSNLLFLEIKDKKIIKLVHPFCFSINGYLEDPRMIEKDNLYYISATEYINNKNIFPVLLIFNKNYEMVKRIDYNRNDYYGLRNFKRIEKNWCPFVYNNKLYLHTDTFPEWKVFEINNYGNMKLIINKKINFVFPNIYLRCSTTWKEFDKEYFICGLHIKDKKIIPIIRSILVLIDKKTFLPIKYTKSFCLNKDKHETIQYLSGLEINELYIILSYGINDYKMVIKKILKSKIKFYNI